MITLNNVDINSEEHIKILFDLLINRILNISHLSNPTYQEHKLFVENNPYRHWFLISDGKELIGSSYISNDNVVGINLLKDKNRYFKEVIKLILKNYKPLEEIKSVRNKNFLINLNPNNNEFNNALLEMNMKHIQNTYIIEDNFS